MDIFPKVQFIVSTHAPEVINSVKKGSVVILRNNEVINATDETYGKDANTILREVMEVSSRPDIIRFLFEKFYELLDSGEWKMAGLVLASYLSGKFRIHSREPRKNKQVLTRERKTDIVYILDLPR